MRKRGFKSHSVAHVMPLILAAVAAGSASAQDSAEANLVEVEEITVTGIRGSLQRAMDIKRDSRGIIDAISAEDMGKFPDTNLAESLQRITGVSIDRVNGEGSRVTVRGFGPDFNLVTLNGRQMPTSSVEETTASSSRSFDFANLASEGVAGVEVYKTGRAAVATGGIGSTINILTTRPLDAPGMKATIGAKGMLDTSTNNGTSLTPEISGLYSNTFADDKFGVALTGSYQKRESGFNQASTPNGWRGAFLGADNDWGTLPQIPDGGTEADINVINRPGPTDVYGVQQSFGYVFNEIDRERVNGQLTLQYRPVESLTATLDYTYSQNKVKTLRNDMSVWFNFGDTASQWTDGPIAGPVFYSEFFATPKDLSMAGGKFAVKNENKSIGFNLEWEATERLRLELDFHSSSAQSGSNNPFGTSAVVSTASFLPNLRQTVDYSQKFPVLSLEFPDGQTGIDASQMLSTGSSFRNSLMRDEINQVQWRGSYAFDTKLIQSVDFGASYVDNQVRSAFSNAQRDTWGGVGSPADIPDDIFELVTISDKFSEVKGHDNPALQNELFFFDFDRMVGLIDQLYGACGGDGVCVADDFTTDRRTKEKSYSAYAQVNSDFDLVKRPAHIVAGLRYEKTDVNSRALVPIATGTQWVANNEFGVIFSNQQDFTQLKGSYDKWLPSVDFDVELVDNVVFRTSYSQTFTRPGYDQIQGGQTVNQLFRVDGGVGSQGDPGLQPFSSKNIDVSTEWYYDEASYFSVGFFHKTVDNFIATSEIQATPFDLPTPFGGKRYNDAVAALGGADDTTAIRNWIFQNADPSTVEILGTDANGNIIGNIFGVAGEDPILSFDITVPVNERRARLRGWEFALQHAFGDTGFGMILNYTIVSGDVKFDNTQPARVAQFALVGLSDSANIIGFYDKNGIEVRVAYNWRDQFLSSTGTAAGPNNPLYTEAFGQLDINASYDLWENVTVFAEAINVTNAYNRVHGRHRNELNFLTQTGPRYTFGARYRF